MHTGNWVYAMKTQKRKETEQSIFMLLQKKLKITEKDSNQGTPASNGVKKKDN